MVNDGGISNSDFGSLHPPVFGEVRGDLEVFIVQDSRGGDIVFNRHSEHDVGLAYLPTFVEDRKRRQVLWVTLRSAAIDPVYDCGNLPGGKAAIVLEPAISGIGVPGRHSFAKNLVLNGPGPGARVAVVKE